MNTNDLESTSETNQIEIESNNPSEVKNIWTNMPIDSFEKLQEEISNKQAFAIIYSKYEFLKWFEKKNGDKYEKENISEFKNLIIANLTVPLLLLIMLIIVLIECFQTGNWYYILYYLGTTILTTFLISILIMTFTYFRNNKISKDEIKIKLSDTTNKILIFTTILIVALGFYVCYLVENYFIIIFFVYSSINMISSVFTSNLVIKTYEKVMIKNQNLFLDLWNKGFVAVIKNDNIYSLNSTQNKINQNQTY